MQKYLVFALVLWWPSLVANIVFESNVPTRPHGPLMCELQLYGVGHSACGQVHSHKLRMYICVRRGFCCVAVCVFNSSKLSTFSR